jgi:hypothetical protein
LAGLDCVVLRINSSLTLPKMAGFRRDVVHLSPDPQDRTAEIAAANAQPSDY